MAKTCFVIMGYGIKNNLNLDLTYNMIIKPCIEENRLIPFPLYAENEYNAFRCDEISGSTAIDYKFVTCLNGADIVIADISTMNANAIYELGARHALKPRSTILLCAKEKEHDFKFFDITYVPIIFYEHEGMSLEPKSVSDARDKLNKCLDFAINSSSPFPDNPIQRALIEKRSYEGNRNPEPSIYELYLKGRRELDNNDYKSAVVTLTELYKSAATEENLMLLSLAQYKIAELDGSCKRLVECINFIKSHIDVEDSTSEYLLGRLAAISLRIFNLSGDQQYYYDALTYYRRGATYSKKNLYCPRNYCALLFRVYEITDDLNIIREHFYTAIHFAKMFINSNVTVKNSGNYNDRVYYQYNVNDLKSITEGEYINFEKMCQRLEMDPDITARQKETITKGIHKLKEDIEQMYSKVNPSLD